MVNKDAAAQPSANTDSKKVYNIFLSNKGTSLWKDLKKPWDTQKEESKKARSIIAFFSRFLKAMMRCNQCGFYMWVGRPGFKSLLDDMLLPGCVCIKLSNTHIYQYSAMVAGSIKGP